MRLLGFVLIQFDWHSHKKKLGHRLVQGEEHVNTGWRWLSIRREASETNLADTSISDFQAPQCDKIQFWCLSHPICGTCYNSLRKLSSEGNHVGNRLGSVALAFEMGVEAFEFTIPLRLDARGEKLSLHHHQRQYVSGYEGTIDARQRMNVHYNNLSSNL